MLKISRGIKRQPLRVLVYGSEGIGKTTFASSFPDAVILDTEGGSHFLDVARADIKDWQSLMVAVRGLVVDQQGFGTVVLDSADWAEQALLRTLCSEAGGKRSIEEIPFGRGYKMAGERFRELLDVFDELVLKGMHVVLTAHQDVKRFSPPDMSEGFDRFEPRLGKYVSGVVQDWADLVLFAQYEDRLIVNAAGKSKGKGGRDRVMHTSRHAAWSAKSRFELPEKMPMSIDSISHLFDAKSERKLSESAQGAADAMLAKIREGLEKDPSKLEDAIAWLQRVGQQEAWPASEVERLVSVVRGM